MYEKIRYMQASKWNNYFIKFLDFKKNLLENSFTRNLGWFGLGQLLIRVSRLVATIILARSLSPYDYGLAAIVLTTYEFINVFNTIGITAKIIHAEQSEVEALCNGAYWLNWVVFSSLLIIQCLASFPIAWFYHDDKLILPICLLSLNYLVGPIGNIQSSLIQRDNRLKVIAIGNSLQISVGNILSAILALLGMGMWSIVLPKLLAFPINNLINLFSHPWRPSSRFTTKGWGEIFSFGTNIMGLCLLKTFRNNLDYLLVGRFLGVRELGTYYFAFNAGLGISQTIIVAVTSTLYPHLCKIRSEYLDFKKSYYKILKTIALIIVPFVFFQTSLAYFYVPVVFSQKWVVAIPILILICLSAIPRTFIEAASILLMAVGKPEVSLRWDLLFTVVFSCALLVGVHWQIIGVAIAVLLSYLLFTPIFSFWVERYVFNQK